MGFGRSWVGFGAYRVSWTGSLGSRLGFWGALVGFWFSRMGFGAFGTTWVGFWGPKLGFWGSRTKFGSSRVGFGNCRSGFLGFWGSWVGFQGSRLGFWGSRLGTLGFWAPLPSFLGCGSSRGASLPLGAAGEQIWVRLRPQLLSVILGIVLVRWLGLTWPRCTGVLGAAVTPGLT